MRARERQSENKKCASSPCGCGFARLGQNVSPFAPNPFLYHYLIATSSRSTGSEKRLQEPKTTWFARFSYDPWTSSLIWKANSSAFPFCRGECCGYLTDWPTYLGSKPQHATRVTLGSFKLFRVSCLSQISLLCPSAYGGGSPLAATLTVPSLFITFVESRPHSRYKTFHIPTGPRPLRVGRPCIISNPSTLRCRPGQL